MTSQSLHFPTSTEAPIILPTEEWGLLMAWEALAWKVAAFTPAEQPAALSQALADSRSEWAPSGLKWLEAIYEDPRWHVCRKEGILIGELLIRQSAQRFIDTPKDRFHLVDWVAGATPADPREVHV